MQDVQPPAVTEPLDHLTLVETVFRCRMAQVEIGKIRDELGFAQHNQAALEKLERMCGIYRDTDARASEELWAQCRELGHDPVCMPPELMPAGPGN
jgi:hypothetical protein